MKLGSLATKWITLLIFFFSNGAILIANSQQTASPQAAVDGQRIFNQSCAGCHDVAGSVPKSGPPLRNYYRRAPRPSDAAVLTTIQHGKGKMPAFSTLTRHQLTDLLAFLRTL